MDIDNTTIKDLAIFDNEDGFSIFNKFDLTITLGGSQKLKHLFNHPLNTIEEIKSIQDTIRTIIELEPYWPKSITNGTLMVIHKFYDSPIDKIPSNATISSAVQYKFLHSLDFSLVKYSASHAFDFIKGMADLCNNYDNSIIPLSLKKRIDTIKKAMNKEQFNATLTKNKFEELTLTELLKFSYFIRYVYKENMFDLIDIFYQLDAWHSMGLANKKFNLANPEFVHREGPHIMSKELYHILLPKPVAYNVQLNCDNNFIFLTGANMAGKSTFIKAIGAAVFLAHVGMGVPANEMQLSLFDGMLSNINIADNLSRGESYFYNEVQRIKNTLLKITDGRKWLVLIDELFKGTNVEDAMTCSTAVIKGLIKIKTSLFILSTHFYEIGEALKKYPNISFKYFETTVSDEQLHFSYQLQNGISNDRLGYLILKREKVIELLDQL